MWTRLTLLALFIGVLGLAIFGLVTKAIRPYQEAGAQKGQMTVTRRQIAEIDRQNEALRRRIAYLQTDEGKTTEARKMGYIKPGEVPIVFEGQPSSGTAADATLSAPPLNSPVSPARHRRSKPRRFWQRLTGY